MIENVFLSSLAATLKKKKGILHTKKKKKTKSKFGKISNKTFSLTNVVKRLG